ncbi:glutaredoxin domain-containing protein [Acinetobacter sp.]|uniref:glutaredoxin domain-containing protein n=1 Tax=Acinetobacter sp. TaxID=472 RepID=UPI00388D66C7
MYTLYTKENCPNCDKAKQLLAAKGLPFQALQLGKDYSREDLVAMIPSARTVPQILKDGQVIGGYTELKQMLA